MASLDLDRIRTIVVTGGAGFLGSHIVDDLLLHCPNARIRVLDTFTYAADMAHLDAAFRTGRVTLQEGDVGNLDLVTEMLKDADLVVPPRSMAQARACRSARRRRSCRTIPTAPPRRPPKC